jgi:hypothetical protein
LILDHPGSGIGYFYLAEQTHVPSNPASLACQTRRKKYQLNMSRL